MANREKANPPKSSQAEIRAITESMVSSEIIEPNLSQNEGHPPFEGNMVTMSIWSGPIPPPEALASYGELVSDAPERIFADFEANSQHRRDIEMQAMRESFRIARLSLGYAFSAIVLFLVAAIFFVFYGYPNIAASLVGATMVAVVGGFLIDRSRSKQTSPQPPRQAKNVSTKGR